MDFRFAPEDEDLREEVRAFLRKELATPRPDGIEGWSFYRSFVSKLAERRWHVLGWPTEWGGPGAGGFSGDGGGGGGGGSW